MLIVARGFGECGRLPTAVRGNAQYVPISALVLKVPQGSLLLMLDWPAMASRLTVRLSGKVPSKIFLFPTSRGGGRGPEPASPHSRWRVPLLSPNFSTPHSASFQNFPEDEAPKGIAGQRWLEAPRPCLTWTDEKQSQAEDAASSSRAHNPARGGGPSSGAKRVSRRWRQVQGSSRSERKDYSASAAKAQVSARDGRAGSPSAAPPTRGDLRSGGKVPLQRLPQEVSPEAGKLLVHLSRDRRAPLGASEGNAWPLSLPLLPLRSEKTNLAERRLGGGRLFSPKRRRHSVAVRSCPALPAARRDQTPVRKEAGLQRSAQQRDTLHSGYSLELGHEYLGSVA